MIKECDRVFNEDGPLRTMKGNPMRIHIKPDVKVIPLNVCTPRKTPIAYMDEAKKIIESDLKLGIICELIACSVDILAQYPKLYIP